MDDLPRTDEEINEDELRELGVHVYGRVPCEFCGKELRIWPTIVEQETSPPSEVRSDGLNMINLVASDPSAVLLYGISRIC